MNANESLKLNISEEVLRELTGFYQRIDRQYGVYRITAVGECIPSSIPFVFRVVRDLITSGAIDASRPFLDAGCGDGRIIALMTLVFRIPAVGIEYDPVIAARARNHLDHLQCRLQGSDCIHRIFCGDFMDSRLYDRNGVPFSSFATLFNYANNHLDIARKVAAESPPGTRFLLYYPSPLPLPLEGLLAEGAFPAAPGSTTAIHLYRKPHPGQPHS